MLDLPDPRSATAIASVMLFFIACLAALTARRRKDSLDHPYAIRLIMISFVILAGLRVYSATSFIWAEFIGDGVISVLRYVVLALTATADILLLTVVIYYFRLIGRGEER
jgi:amino acid transporter